MLQPGQLIFIIILYSHFQYYVSNIFNEFEINSVRVSNELGAGNPKSAAFSIFVVNFVSFILALAVAAIVLWQRHRISYIFTSGDTVANAVSELCPFLSVTLILNGIQPILSGNIFLSKIVTPSSIINNQYLVNYISLYCLWYHQLFSLMH